MDPTDSFAANHAGVFTRTVARAAGYSDTAIYQQLRRRRWVRLRTGVYVDAARWHGADKRAKHVMMAHAVALRCHFDATFSHISGAVIRGWPSWNLSLETVCVTRGPMRSAREEAGVHHYVANLPTDQVENIGGLRVCSKERLMVEAARYYGFEEAVVIGDAALRDGASRAKAVELFRRTHTWPRSAGAARVLQFADGRAENPAESRLRVALHLQGIDEFKPQVELRAPNGRLLGRGDLVDEANRVLIELDGKAKYGIDGQDPREQLWQEKVREDQIRGLLNYEVLRFYWVHLDNHRQIGQRVRAAQDLGHRRRVAA